MIGKIAAITAWLHALITKLHMAALQAKHEALTLESEVHDWAVAEQAAAISVMQKALVRLHEAGTEAQAVIASKQASINAELRKLGLLK